MEVRAAPVGVTVCAVFSRFGSLQVGTGADKVKGKRAGQISQFDGAHTFGNFHPNFSHKMTKMTLR